VNLRARKGENAPTSVVGAIGGLTFDVKEGTREFRVAPHWDSTNNTTQLPERTLQTLITSRYDAEEWLDLHFVISCSSLALPDSGSS
jgi:hypothetical protein